MKKKSFRVEDIEYDKSLANSKALERNYFIPPHPFSVYFHLAKSCYKREKQALKYIEEHLPEIEINKVLNIKIGTSGYWRVIFCNDKKGIIVAIEGTSSVLNVNFDLQAFFKKMSSFLLVIKSEIDELSQELGMDVLGFTGHSAGGTIGYRLIENHYKDCYGVFFNAFDTSMTAKVLNFRTSSDPVSGLFSNKKNYTTIMPGYHKIQAFWKLKDKSWGEIGWGGDEGNDEGHEALSEKKVSKLQR